MARLNKVTTDDRLNALSAGQRRAFHSRLLNIFNSATGNFSNNNTADAIKDLEQLAAYAQVFADKLKGGSI